MIGRSTAAANMRDRHGVPHTREELQEHAIIGGGGGKLWRHYEAWLRIAGPGGPGSDAPCHVDRPAVRQSAPGLGSRCSLASSPMPNPTWSGASHRATITTAQMWLLTHERVRAHAPRPPGDRFPLRSADAPRPHAGRTPRRGLADRTAAPFRHRPLANCHFDRRCGQQPGGIEDRQRRYLLRDQQRNFSADQRHRVAALVLQLVDDPHIGLRAIRR